MTIADIISAVRRNMSDTITQEVDEGLLLQIIKQAIIRANTILVKNDIPFARTRYTFDTVAATEKYDLPSGFGAVYGLYRTDNKTEIEFLDIDKYERAYSPGEATVWTIMDDSGTQKIWIAGTPSGVISMVFHYYPLLDVSSYTTATTMPWSGRLDYPIINYVTIVAQNYDEMDYAQDGPILQQLEEDIVKLHKLVSPQTVTRRGWN